MNERIHDLAEQAAEYAAQNATGDWEVGPAYQDLFNKKFAELIVRDCMKVASPNYMSTPEDSVYYVEQAIDRIAEHFGVEP